MGPARLHNRRAGRRMLALSAAAALIVALASGCSSAPTPSANAANHGHRIDTRTPPGLRAQQTMDMLNSDWPIGEIGVGTLAAPGQVDTVKTTMEALWWDRPFALAGVDIGASVAALHLISSYGAQQDIRIHTDDDGWVDRFDVETQAPSIASWRDVDAVLSKTGARYSFQVAKVDNGRCDPVAGTNTGESLPLASIFKLYVLHALAGAVQHNTVSWDDLLTVTAKSKAVGSSGLELPVGARVSVRTAAEKMIATSDNMATDLLIERLGTRAIEEALASAGHHDPASMTPSPRCTSCYPSAGASQICVTSGSMRPNKSVPRYCGKPIPRPTNPTQRALTLRRQTTVRNGTAAPKISAVCTRHCEPTRSARPRPSDRSCPPSRVSSWTAACGPISARKQVACQAI